MLIMKALCRLEKQHVNVVNAYFVRMTSQIKLWECKVVQRKEDFVNEFQEGTKGTYL